MPKMLIYSYVWLINMSYAELTSSYLNQNCQELVFLKVKSGPDILPDFQEHISLLLRKMDPSGFEPEASSLQGRRSNPD